MRVLSFNIQKWEKLNEEISLEMKKFSGNYKCKVCQRQPRNAWCKHLLQARTRKFIKRIKGADSLLF